MSVRDRRGVKDGDEEIWLPLTSTTEKSSLVDGKPEEETKRTSGQETNTLIFGVTDVPPIPIVLVFALQVVISNISGPLAFVTIVRDFLCGADDLVFVGNLINSSIFMCGICTVLQVTFGVRLPIFQGSSYSFLPPLIIVLSSERFSCTAAAAVVANVTRNGTETGQNDELWRAPLLEVSGSLAVASLCQVVLGGSGAIGFLLRFIGPLTVVPVIGLIGFSANATLVNTCQHQWGVAFLTIAMVFVCSLFLKDFQVPLPIWRKGVGCTTTRYPLFRIFANVWGIIAAWLLAWVLTAAGALPESKDEVGFYARTDARIQVMSDSAWFYLPYPGQFGMPTFAVSTFLGMLIATLASVVESIGDYIATGLVCKLPSPPDHAMNRGVAMEGFGSIVTALVGTMHGTTSYSNTMGFISYTGAASRIMWVAAGVMLMIVGVFGKFGALLTIIPDPVLGGMLFIGLGSMIGVALSNLHKVDMESPRNQLILGSAFLLGFIIPDFMEQYGNKPLTHVLVLDQAIGIILRTSPFVGGIFACFLDNILPGSHKMRGFVDSDAAMDKDTSVVDHEKEEELLTAYHPPRPITALLVRVPCLQRLPIFPKLPPKQLNFESSTVQTSNGLQQGSNGVYM